MPCPLSRAVSRTKICMNVLAYALFADMLWWAIPPGKEFVHDCEATNHVDELREEPFPLISADIRHPNTPY